MNILHLFITLKCEYVNMHFRSDKQFIRPVISMYSTYSDGDFVQLQQVVQSDYLCPVTFFFLKIVLLYFIR